jgi:hypothetical protein
MRRHVMQRAIGEELERAQRQTLPADGEYLHQCVHRRHR